MSHRDCFQSRENVYGLFFECFFFPSHIRVSKATLLPPVSPTTQQQREVGKRTAPLERVYSQQLPVCATTVVCTHSWMELCRTGKEGRLGVWFFFFLFLFFFSFILSKEGTKSQPSFKPTAAQELTTSPKASVFMWELSTLPLLLRGCACIWKVQLRQKALPKVCALLRKVKPCWDKEKGMRKSLGLKWPFSNVRATEICLWALTLLFPRADLIWEVFGSFGGDHCLSKCKVWCYAGGWGYPYPGMALLSQGSLRRKSPSP